MASGTGRCAGLQGSSLYLILICGTVVHKWIVSQNLIEQVRIQNIQDAVKRHPIMSEE